MRQAGIIEIVTSL